MIRSNMGIYQVWPNPKIQASVVDSAKSVMATADGTYRRQTSWWWEPHHHQHPVFMSTTHISSKPAVSGGPISSWFLSRISFSWHLAVHAFIDWSLVAQNNICIPGYWLFGHMSVSIAAKYVRSGVTLHCCK